MNELQKARGALDTFCAAEDFESSIIRRLGFEWRGSCGDSFRRRGRVGSHFGKGIETKFELIIAADADRSRAFVREY